MKQSSWSPKEESLLRELYPTHTARQVSRIMGTRSPEAVKARAGNLKLTKNRKHWTKREDALLRKIYPHMSTLTVAKRLGFTNLEGISRGSHPVNQRAAKLRLHKTAKYMASPDACRLRRGDNVGAPYRFKPGNVPYNKGLRRPGWAPGRMKETQFKKGVRCGIAIKLYKPIGTQRISKDGYLEQKVNDDLPLQRRWRAVHILIWEKKHGHRLPKGRMIIFKDGNKRNIKLPNLKCITRAANMRRNTIHNLPEPLRKVLRLAGKLKRTIKKQKEKQLEQRNEGQDAGGSAGPSVRHHRAA